MSALAFLVWRSFVNSVRFRVGRLRHPRYFVPLLAVLAYLWVASGMRGLASADEVAGLWAPQHYAAVYVQIVAVALAVGGWLTSADRPAPTFTEAEVLALFQAPLTRRSLIVYSIVRTQPALILVALALALIWPRPGSAAVAAQALGVFFLVNLLRLNNLVAALATAAMLARGARSLVARMPGLVVAAYVAIALGLAVPRDAPAPADLTGLLRWVDLWLHTRPARQLLWPWRTIAELPFSSTPSSLVSHLAAGVAVLGTHVAVALILSPPFEDAALSQAQNLTKRLDAFRRGRVAAVRLASLTTASPTRLRLASAGPAWRAVVWKDWVGFLRGFGVRQGLVVLLSVALPPLVALVSDTDEPSLLIGAGAWGLVMLMMIGPGAYGQGIRSDLQLVEYVKTIPVPGRQLLRGSVVGATVVLSTLGMAVVAITAAVFLRASSLPVVPLSLASASVATLILFSTACSFIVVVECALAVVAPAWVLPDKGQVGLENVGRELVVTIGRFVGLSLLSIPLTIVGAPLAAIVVHRGLVWSAPAALVIAVIGAFEVEAMLAWLGRKLDTLDPSRENLV